VITLLLSTPKGKGPLKDDGMGVGKEEGERGVWPFAFVLRCEIMMEAKRSFTRPNYNDRRERATLLSNFYRVL